MVKKFLKDENGDIIVKNGNPLRVNITSEEEFHNLKIQEITMSLPYDILDNPDFIVPDENTPLFYTYEPDVTCLDNQVNTHITITSEYLTDKDIENIKNGKLFLCLNYLLRSHSRHSEERYGFSNMPHGNLYDVGLIKIEESDIKENVLNHTKIIKKVIHTDELLFRMLNASRSDDCYIPKNLQGGLQHIDNALEYNNYVKNDLFNTIGDEFFINYNDTVNTCLKPKQPISENTSLIRFFCDRILNISATTYIHNVGAKDSFLSLSRTPIRNLAFFKESYKENISNGGDTVVDYNIPKYVVSGLYSCENFYENSNIIYENKFEYSPTYDYQFHNLANVIWGNYGFLHFSDTDTPRVSKTISRYSRNLKVKFNFIIKDTRHIEFKGDKFYKIVNINYRPFTYTYLDSNNESQYLGCLEYIVKFK